MPKMGEGVVIYIHIYYLVVPKYFLNKLTLSMHGLHIQQIMFTKLTQEKHSAFINRCSLYTGSSFHVKTDLYDVAPLVLIQDERRNEIKYLLFYLKFYMNFMTPCDSELCSKNFHRKSNKL